MDRVQNGTEGPSNSFIKGTILDHVWQQDMQEELIAIIVDAGLTPTQGVQDQLLEAIDLKLASVVAGSTRIFGNARLGSVTISDQPGADAIFTGPGLYDFADLTIDTAPITLPFGCYIRSQGNVTIDQTITVANPVLFSNGSGDGIHYDDYGIAMAAGFRMPFSSVSAIAAGDREGGSSAGKGGPGLATGFSINNQRLAGTGNVLTLSPFVGQVGNYDVLANVKAGGGICIVSGGDIILTGATINANAADLALNEHAGSGAGCIMCVCLGTLTDGTFNANGGNANTVASQNNSGGGGGYIGRAATAFAGTQTDSVTGGAGVTGAAAGSAGIAESFTLTAAEILGLGGH